MDSLVGIVLAPDSMAAEPLQAPGRKTTVVHREEGYRAVRLHLPPWADAR